MNMDEGKESMEPLQVMNAVANELLQRGQGQVVEPGSTTTIFPTGSYLTQGQVNLVGNRAGKEGVTNTPATILLLHNEDLDQVVTVLIPYGVATRIGKDLMESDRQIDAWVVANEEGEEEGEENEEEDEA